MGFNSGFKGLTELNLLLHICIYEDRCASRMLPWGDGRGGYMLMLYLSLIFEKSCLKYKSAITLLATASIYIPGVQLKSGQHFNMSNLFTKIYNMLHNTTNLYLQ